MSLVTEMSRTEAAYDTYMGVRHFGCLDGLRFICIAAVLWHHSPLWPGMIESVGVIVTRGHTGVDFFFVLSGFLITTLLLREEARDGSFSLKGFYWRRILRIVPIYFLVVTVAAVYNIGIKGRTEGLEILPYYYLFLANFIEVEDIGFLAPTWSLAVEEQYYLIWPLLLLLLPRRWIVPGLIAMIATNVAIALDVFTQFGITGFDVGPLRFGVNHPTYAPILMGSLAAVILNSRTGFRMMWPITGFPFAPWAYFALLIGVMMAVPGMLAGWPNLAVHTLMVLMLISLSIREDNAMAPVMHLKPIVRIGQISYGVYLYHLFALSLVGWVFRTIGYGNDVVLLVVYSLLSFLIAEISFRTYEAYFMQFRKRGLGRTQAG